MSKYSILPAILQGKIYGKSGPGGRIKSWFHNLSEWFGKSSSELFRVTTDKESIAGMVANIRNRICT
jgi:hypothetical protein